MQDGDHTRMVPSDKPVGVFDSGVGGLSVLRALREELPGEHFLYVGDSGYAPYGDRSPDFVTERANTITNFLGQKGAKAIVVACNTATAVAVESLRARFAMPIVAIEPAVKPAASRTRSRVVGVLATTGTLSSPNVGKLLASYGSDVEFVIQPCPGLADRVEKGELASEDTRELVKRYLRPILDKGGDIVVLGCTHYPFLRPLIQELAGPGVDVIDPAMPVARELRRRLESAELMNASGAAGTERFWTTGKVEVVEPIVRQLWDANAVVAGLTSLRQGYGGPPEL
jgi:glutamate racemase